jgi:hypothetical protein
MEEGDIKLVKKWGIDSGHEVLQVFADPSELKLSESGKGRARGQQM